MPWLALAGEASATPTSGTATRLIPVLVADLPAVGTVGRGELWVAFSGTRRR